LFRVSSFFIFPNVYGPSPGSGSSYNGVSNKSSSGIMSDSSSAIKELQAEEGSASGLIRDVDWVWF
jgi:hypothetical protein